MVSLNPRSESDVALKLAERKPVELPSPRSTVVDHCSFPVEDSVHLRNSAFITFSVTPIRGCLVSSGTAKYP